MSRNIYAHGGGIKSFAEEYGIPPEEVIDMSANINFLKIPSIPDMNLLNIENYPDYTDLYTAVANSCDVSEEEIELFNGASSAIFSLFRSLQADKCVIYAPVYAEYRRAAELNGYSVTLINRFSDIDAPVPEGAVVVFVNPSTPDGRLYDLSGLLERWEKAGCTVIIDESFIDFTNSSSLCGSIREYDNLYIIKSLTKIMGAAGVRIGLIIGNESGICRIKTAESLWKISEYDMAYVLAFLKDKSFIEKSRQENSKNRDFLKEILEGAECIEKVFESDANFLLVKLKDTTAETLQNKLAEYKIMIRNCDNFDFLDNSFVRIAVKDTVVLNKLKEALNA